MVPRVKGTQDFLDMTLFNFIIATFKEYAARYNYAEISLPILEHVDLFKRSLGLETDVVSKEMYLVGTGREDDESLCLRPEATASVMRAFFTNAIEDRPWKVFLYGPMFRHERPQKGRYRQFSQVTIEALAAPSLLHDVELMAFLHRFFSEGLSLRSYALHINFLGCPQDRIGFKQVLYNFLQKHETALCSTCKERKEKNILRVFDCKNEQCQSLYAQAPVLVDHLCEQCSGEWIDIQDSLQEMSVPFVVMPTLVRGLDYYNKTVFEFVSLGHLGAQSTFCGGGRYDALSVALGEKEEIPSLGAGFGIERLLLMLEAQKETLPLQPQKPLHVVVPFGQEQKKLALLVGDVLRNYGLCCEVYVDIASVKSMMRRAGKSGARYALLLGSDELQNNYVTVKHMITGQETKVSQQDLIAFLKQ